MKNKIRILHIDDNLHDRQLVKDALLKEHDEFVLVQADNREKFERYLDENSFDLVLSDFNLPGIDGLQVLQIIKEKAPDIPVIIVTGTGSEEIAIQAMKMGAADYVIKSVNHIRGLAQAIKNVLENKKVQHESRIAQIALQENERRLSNIYDTVGDAIFHLAVEADGSYRFISANRAFFNVTGLSEKMVIGKLVNKIIPESSLSKLLGKFRQVIEENSIIRWEETYEYPAGQLTSDISIAPVVDDKGRCTHLVGSFHDITEYKRAEEELQESEKRYRLLLQQARDSIMLLELPPDGIPIIRDANTAAQQTLGYSHDELIGQPVSMLDAEKDFAPLVKERNRQAQ